MSALALWLRSVEERFSIEAVSRQVGHLLNQSWRPWGGKTWMFQ